MKSGKPWQVRRHTLGDVRPAPLMGQHNEYVLRDLLALTPARNETLAAERVVDPPAPRPGGEALFQLRPPSLVLLSITPFGLTGPYAAFRSAPLNTHHAGGQGFLFPPSLEDLDRPPRKSAGNAGEYEAATGVAVAAIGALFGRHLTGEGELIDFSKQQWEMTLNRPFHARYTADGVVETPATQAIPGAASLPAPMAICCCSPCRTISGPGCCVPWRIPAWAKTSASLLRASGAPTGALRRIIADWMRVRPPAEVLATLARNGAPASPVQTPVEVLQYDDYKLRGSLQPLPLPSSPHACGPGCRLPQIRWRLTRTVLFA